jgi:hypothetical protein
MDPQPLNGCEGCWHCEFPGIRWPASPDGFTDLSYVDRCDACQLYESDEDAAQALAQHYGVAWGYAERTNPANIRWTPDENDGLDYTGWSAFIDRPERDGQDAEPAHGDRNWYMLRFINPGQKRALVDALTEHMASLGAEVSSGDRNAIAYQETLKEIIEDIEVSKPTTGSES